MFNEWSRFTIDNDYPEWYDGCTGNTAGPCLLFSCVRSFSSSSCQSSVRNSNWRSCSEMSTGSAMNNSHEKTSRQWEYCHYLCKVVVKLGPLFQIVGQLVEGIVPSCKIFHDFISTTGRWSMFPNEVLVGLLPQEKEKFTQRLAMIILVQNPDW